MNDDQDGWVVGDLPDDALQMLVHGGQVGIGHDPDEDGVSSYVLALLGVEMQRRDGTTLTGPVALVLPPDVALAMSADLAVAASRIVPDRVQVVRYHGDAHEDGQDDA